MKQTYQIWQFIAYFSLFLVVTLANGYTRAEITPNISNSILLAQAAPNSTPNQNTSTPKLNRNLKSPPSVDTPTEVSVGFQLLNLGKINQVDETFDITGFLYITWKDPRLAFDPNQTGDQVMRYTPEQIWEPNLTIFNSNNFKKGAVQLSVKPDGSVSYLELVYTTVTSRLNLKLFPFDTQTIEIIWEPLSADTKGLTLKKNDIAIGYTKDRYASVSEWTLLGIDAVMSNKKAEKEDKIYPRFTYRIFLKRNYTFYLFKVVLPLALITFVSWTAFWFNPATALVPQINVGVTSILTAITFNFTVANSLPRVSYLTLIDAYILICYLFFFAGLIVTAAVHYLLNIAPQDSQQPMLITQRCRWLFPVAFVVLQIIVLSSFSWS